MRSWASSGLAVDRDFEMGAGHSSPFGFEPISSSGSFAMLTAIRRASSRVSRFTVRRRPGSSSK
jgi:hypothetical protein